MICEGGGKATEIFIGDISSVIFQSQRSSVSLGLLDRLVHAGINVVFCDRRMFPYSMLVPFAGSGDSAGKLREQLLWTDRDCDRVWKKIVSDKISSQTRLLGYFGIFVVPEYQVADGDAENAEGNFARYYFSKLFGTTFRRHIADDVNGALDYGYTVLLSHMARIISSRGYSLQLGVHHRGARNNFNLACDVMEPFRPLTDRIVCARSRPLDREYKLALADRREYRRFVVGIKRLGYSMIQRSVYYRVNEGSVSGRSEYTRIAAITPGTIEIRIIEITERIFRNMLSLNCGAVDLSLYDNSIICV